MLACRVSHLHRSPKMAATSTLTPKKSSQMRSSTRPTWTIRSSCAIQSKSRTTKIFLATKSSGDNRSKVSSRALIPPVLRYNYFKIKCCCGSLSSCRTDCCHQPGGTTCKRQQGCRTRIAEEMRRHGLTREKSAFYLRSCGQAI